MSDAVDGRTTITLPVGAEQTALLVQAHAYYYSLINTMAAGRVPAGFALLDINTDTNTLTFARVPDGS